MTSKLLRTLGMGIALTLTALIAGARAQDALPAVVNGDMSAGTQKPDGWSEPNSDEGTLSVSRDTAVFASAPASLKLQAVGGAASGNVLQRLEGVSGKSLAFSGKMKSSAGAGVQVAVIGFDSAGKVVMPWKQLGTISGERDWTPFNATVAFDASVHSALLLLFTNGTGSAWFDDIVVLSPGAAPAAAAPAAVAVAAGAAAVDKGDGTSAIYEFDGKGFQVAYLAFEKAITVGPAFVTIGGEGVTDAGGALVNADMDLSALAATTPYLVVRPGSKHQAERLGFRLADAAGTSTRYSFLIKGLPTDQFSVVYPEDGATLGEPGTLENEDQDLPRPLKLDLAHIKQMQIQGNWQNKPVDVAIQGVYAASNPPAAVAAAKTKAIADRKQAAEEAQKQAQARTARLNELLVNCPHPADGAAVVNIAPVGSDILGIELQAGEYHYGGIEPYTAKPDDQLIDGVKDAWVVRNGKMAQEVVGQKVQRKGADGKTATLGTITFDRKQVLVPDRVTGTPLELITVTEPRAYVIQSTDDPAYAAGVSPTAVYQKSKPNSPNNADGGFTTLHQVYLKLPSPLKQSATYSVNFKAVNTRDAKTTFVNDSRKLRSEAVHASHVGYDAGSPFKRAYLSVWLGTGGGYDHAGVDTFELLDAKTGAVAYSGEVVVGKPLGAAEQLKVLKDYAMTAVRWLDFSDFTTPGTYVVHVPGIGTSYPLTLGDHSVWEAPAKLSLQGIMTQRSSIALGPPTTPFVRPRPYHPEEGDTFYQMDINISDGQEGARGEALVRLWKQNSKLEEAKGVWGGYQDAGDWDSYTTSLITANHLTELFEVAGDYAKNLKLTLPGNESTDAIPDLLNEAVWGLQFYKRIQLPDGGVRDGFGDAEGARDGDLSWNNSNPVGVYAASVPTSYLYAGAAAMMSRLLSPYDKPQAEAFSTSAVAAWDWARKQPGEPAAPKGPASADMAYAAVQLYWLTGEAAYHDAFKAATELHDKVPAEYTGGWIEPTNQNHATFTYARLPDALADATLKQNALARYALAGKVGKAFAAGNAFNIATAFPGIPVGDFLGYFTAPGGIVNIDLVRAAYLSGNADDLATVLASTNFTLGANPENMAMTTGLGPNPVKFPLKLDSRRSGQPAPVGITVYGAADQSTPQSDWVHIWMLGGDKTVPNSRSWPPPESYFDVFGWPGCNEFTVDRPMSLSAYTWTYLASQAAK